ncbi:hypothetical protein GCM10022282_09210 [Agromyces indicus]
MCLRPETGATTEAARTDVAFEAVCRTRDQRRTHGPTSGALSASRGDERTSPGRPRAVRAGPCGRVWPHAGPGPARGPGGPVRGRAGACGRTRTRAGACGAGARAGACGPVGPRAVPPPRATVDGG